MAVEEGSTADDSLKQYYISLGIAVVWFALFCDYLLMTIAVPVFPTLGASTFATGALFSAKAALQIVSSPFVAMVIDTKGLLLLIIGLAIEALSTLVFAVTVSYSWWFAARAVQGVASSLILASGFLHIQRLHGGDEAAIGVSMGIATTGIIVGVCIGPPLGGILYDLGSALPFLITAALVFIAAACALAYYKKVPQPPSEASSQTENVSSVACSLLLDKHIAVTLLAVFIANATISCLEGTLGNYLQREMGFSAAGTGLLYIVTAGPTVFSAKAAGHLGNRYGRWLVIGVGLAVQGVFYAVGPKNALASEVVSLVGLGIGMGLVDGCSPAMLAQVSALFHQGTGVVYTLLSVAVQFGFLLGPLCGSAIMQATSFQTMSIVLGVLMVLAAPAMLVNATLPNPDTRPLQREEADVGIVAMTREGSDGAAGSAEQQPFRASVSSPREATLCSREYGSVHDIIEDAVADIMQ